MQALAAETASFLSLTFMAMNLSQSLRSDPGHWKGGLSGRVLRQVCFFPQTGQSPILLSLSYSRSPEIRLTTCGRMGRGCGVGSVWTAMAWETG